MEICHGTWIPDRENGFDNYGKFVVWVETSNGGAKKAKAGEHPDHLSRFDGLHDFMSSRLSLKKLLNSDLKAEPARFHVTLPTDGKFPLPSLEMAQLTGDFLPDKFSWQPWMINGLAFDKPLPLLRELKFVAALNQGAVNLGNDLWFWVHYAQQLRMLVRMHQFLPVMKCYQAGNKRSDLQIHTGWSPAASRYEDGLREFAEVMPGICTAVSVEKPRNGRGQVQIFDRTLLLRHFSEQQVEGLVANTPITKKALKQLGGSWLVDALGYRDDGWPKGRSDDSGLTLEDWKQWRSWQREIIGRSKQDTGFVLGLRLHQFDKERDNAWRLSFFVASNRDPSLRIDLDEWWVLSDANRAQWLKHFGQQFERNLLVNMGHAARTCPLLWHGMETSRPTGVDIDMQTAYEFLKNDAIVLESAGFRIVLPHWCTPEGRRRARLRIKASARSGTQQAASGRTGMFNLPTLVEYSYELSVDGEPVSEAEWLELVNAKSTLVRFRGEWMELDSQQMNRMLELWRQQDSGVGIHTVGDMLKEVAEADTDETEFVFDEVLNEILKGLQQVESIQELDTPPGFEGQLRAYQKKGLSWLVRQEALGLNPCLADDMGLGKTIQVIALLMHERAGQKDKLPPTLLIAPTSVLSNWQKEIEKFAPQLASMIHHGSGRASTPAEFKKQLAGCDIAITSFALARRDKILLAAAQWQRIVVDEAQNIKNPKSAQARVICSLKAPRRIAMTGTPIENRLMDMWSLFHFLNPGYLGTSAQFSRAYERPIQRDGNQILTQQLQKLVQPFILRRLKTDPAIINDLPEKLELKVYCNLTKEQASLYQAVVDEVTEEIEVAKGMQRRGLILATLMKLKQICNHPAQFLQDGSAFTEVRSHKLTRMNGMIEEALTESDSLLLFTQFTEVGKNLEKLLRERHRSPVYYLHGGTSRKRREQMIESFQDPEMPPGIFILSLKAGGVGVTLTQANHVFHFDRWWNPAVEDQATDRAYRIGQKKTVFAHKMVTLGTLEERIDEMIERKNVLAESIVGSDESWITEMENDSFRELIQLNRSAIMDT